MQYNSQLQSIIGNLLSIYKLRKCTVIRLIENKKDRMQMECAVKEYKEDREVSIDKEMLCRDKGK